MHDYTGNSLAIVIRVSVLLGDLLGIGEEGGDALPSSPQRGKGDI